MEEEIVLVNKPVTKSFLKEIALKRFGDMIKAVVDIEKGILALGAELHADEESYLLERGSRQENLWGINLYPDLGFPQCVEFDSMINIRPSQNNRSRSVENPELRDKITDTVLKLVI